MKKFMPTCSFLVLLICGATSGQPLKQSNEAIATLYYTLLTLPILESTSSLDECRDRARQALASCRQKELEELASALHGLHWRNDGINGTSDQGRFAINQTYNLASKFQEKDKNYRNIFVKEGHPIPAIPNDEVLKEMRTQNVPMTSDNIETWELILSMRRLDFLDQTTNMASAISENSFDIIEYPRSKSSMTGSLRGA